jgi:4-hydroxy-2-oxoheptanedioate aldolase
MPTPTPPPLLPKTGPLLGTFSTLGSIDAVELACHSGLDFLILDAQHGNYSLDSLRHALRACHAANTFAFVRLPANSLSLVEPLLDAGCMGLIAPMVNSIDEAKALVRAVYYPPLGVRSQSSCRASVAIPDYRKTFNSSLTLLAMIEHKDALRNVDDIAALNGISGLLVGPTDLASSLEHLSSSEQKKELARATAHVLSTCHTRGKISAIAAGALTEAHALAKQGYQLIVHATDRRFLQSAFTNVTETWKKTL